MTEVQSVFVSDPAQIFTALLTAAESGFYNVTFSYSQSAWDAWAKLDVTGENGETDTYIPPFPKKYTETTMLLYLYKGENRLSAAPRCDQPIVFYGVRLSEKKADLRAAVTPSGDFFYMDDPTPRRLMVASYVGAPVKITAEGAEIPFELEDKSGYLCADPVETKEPPYYYHLRLHPEALSVLNEGAHTLRIILPDESALEYTLTVQKTAANYAFTIVSLDVNHGNATLLRLPNGKNLLIDTGTEPCAEEVLFPYFDKKQIAPDYCLVTHFHEDHIGSLDAVMNRYPFAKPDEREAEQYVKASQKEREAYLAKFRYVDPTMLCRYDRLDRIWDLGGVEVTVLNSCYEADGADASQGSIDKNATSLSLLIRYNGFQYYHGADNYAPMQQRNLDDFTAWGRVNELACHYMQANHHFHGDVCVDLIRAINPIAVFVPANQAIYSRSAFMVDYLQGVVQADYPNKRIRETFVSYMSGTVEVHVNDAEDWHYETC